MLFKKRIEPDWDSESYKQARSYYLSQFLFGETGATGYCERMARFAPTPEAAAFLLEQHAEEERHAELLMEAVQEMHRAQVKIAPHLRMLDCLMEQALGAQNWSSALFIQNFIIEGISLTVFQQQRKYGDEVIMHIFDQIIRDEEKHAAFGVREMQKLLAGTDRRKIERELIPLQRVALFHAVMIFKDMAREAGPLGLAWDELAKAVVGDHLHRIAQVPFTLPLPDKLFLKAAIRFFTFV